MKDKIFDPEVEKYLLETGVSQKEINKIKLRIFKAEAKRILELFIKNIDKKEEYIEDYISFSPAGDYTGYDDNFIDFGGIISNETTMNIKEALAYIKDLEEGMKEE